MKKFFKKIIVYFLISIIAIEAVGYLQRITGIFEIYIPGREAHFAIRKSKQKNDSKILLLGDSVAEQLFSAREFNHNPNSLSSDQAISLVGNYILLKNYLNQGNVIDSLVLIYNPISFANNLDQVFTFHHFLKPFGQGEYDSLFTETVKTQIKKIPFHYTVKSSYIFTSQWSPDYMPETVPKNLFISEISKEYLSKIKELSMKEKFKLILVPPPVKETAKSFVNMIDRNEYKGLNFETEMDLYFERINFENANKYIDEVHFKETEIESQREKIRTEYF